MKMRILALLGICVLAHAADAQMARDTIVVMTVPLKYLDPEAAVQLLEPYATTVATANSPAGGVFLVPGGRAITIRERLAQYGRMLTILREYDRAPRQLEFAYHVILADRSQRKLKEAALDSLLRSAIAFSGFSTVGSGLVRMGGQSDTTASIDDPRFQYKLKLDLSDPPGTPADATARLDLTLSRAQWPVDGKATGFAQTLLYSRNVQIPLGQTVVLGTKALDRDRAIILIMRPDVLSRSKAAEKSLLVVRPEQD